jgi:hypothetical protein
VSARTVAPALALLAALAGCGEDKEPISPVEAYRQATTQQQQQQEQATTSDDEPQEKPKPKGPPKKATVKIVAPKPNAKTGPDVRVRFEVSGLELATPENFADADRAHLHVLLDEGKFDDPQHSPAPGSLVQQDGSGGRYSPVIKTTIVYQDIPRGRHKVRVEIVAGDHNGGGLSSDAVEFDVGGQD